MRWLLGTSVPIKCGRGHWAQSTCDRAFSSGTELQIIQENFKRAGGYDIPGGAIIGGTITRPRVVYNALREGKKLWYLTAPDPFGIIGVGLRLQGQEHKQIHLGRAFEISTAAKELIKEAQTSQGTYRGYPTSMIWLHEYVAPRLQAEAQEIAEGRKRAADRARETSQASQKRRNEQAQQEDVDAVTSLPWIPIVAIGLVGVYFLRRG